jgi:hypothetical protein
MRPKLTARGRDETVFRHVAGMQVREGGPLRLYPFAAAGARRIAEAEREGEHVFIREPADERAGRTSLCRPCGRLSDWMTAAGRGLP